MCRNGVQCRPGGTVDETTFGVAHPDRLVFDLDPGPGVGLTECAQVARAVRERMEGSAVVPVTSGSKGIHLYSRLDGSLTSDDASMLAREIAEAIEQDMPDLVVSRMAKVAAAPERCSSTGRRTTARRPPSRPTRCGAGISPPLPRPGPGRNWPIPDLRHLEYPEVLDLLAEAPDPMQGLETGDNDGAEHRKLREPAKTLRRQTQVYSGTGETATGTTATQTPVDGQEARQVPVDAVGRPHPGTRPRARVPATRQRRHLRHPGAPRPPTALRLPAGTRRRAGVLGGAQGHPGRAPGRTVWPCRPRTTPWTTRTSPGDIPRGEYGGGTVTIWDAGTYATEKWRDDEVIIVLNGQRARGRYVLIRTDGNALADAPDEGPDAGPGARD